MATENRRPWHLVFAKHLLVGSALALFAMLAAPTAISGSKESSAHVLQLKRALQSQDMRIIVRAMNEVKKNQESASLLAFVVDLWHQRVADVPSNVLIDPAVRVELANVLAQASNNGFIRIDREPLRQYSREVIAGNDLTPKMTAVLNLGLLNDARDVELLKKVAEEEHPRTFRAAVISLARICSKDAEAALSALIESVRSSDNRKFARTPVSELVPYRQCR